MGRVSASKVPAGRRARGALVRAPPFPRDGAPRASTPYRTAARSPDRPGETPPGGDGVDPLLLGALGFVFVTSLVRAGYGLLETPPMGREAILAAVLLVLSGYYLARFARERARAGR
jgi:hypothetical protein